MTTSFARRLRAAALSLAVVAIAACGESTTPFDAIALSQNTAEIINTMDDSPAMQSMSVLGEKMTLAAPGMESVSLAVASLPTADLAPAGFPAWGARRLAAVQAALPAFSVAAPRAVIIPDQLEGAIFAYDLQSESYVLASQTGGPDNGVRFRLYAVNPVTHSVVEPLNEVGYVDVIDESTSTSALQLHLKAYITESGNTPLIDYTASATIQGTPSSPTGATVAATGYLSDGTTTVELDLSQTYSSATGALQVEYTLSVPEKDVEVTFEATQTFVATVTLTVTHGGNTTVVAASGTLASISGTIKHNGNLVMNISGSPENPVFTDPSGNPPTAEQAAALRSLFDFADQLLAHIDEMLAPAYALLGIAAFFV